ncbi:MAG: hypothetical protein JXA42_25585 [Anaerolineales bacterium]|nr:hypothetical protein [Anaerolineales bacterium]
MSDRQLSAEWSDLQDEDKVPSKGVGETARRAERDKRRIRPRMPAEDRRMGRKIAPTLSSELVQRLRTICKREGYIGKDGEGIIASPIIEDLLWVGVEAYEAGELVPEEVVTVVQRRLRRKRDN